MKAIQTKFIGPTDNKGAKITAWAQTADNDRQSVTIPYPQKLGFEAACRLAAVKLCEKLGWPTDLVSGSTKDGYVFVNPN